VNAGRACGSASQAGRDRQPRLQGGELPLGRRRGTRRDLRGADRRDAGHRNEVGRERLEDIPQLRKARDIATELYLRFRQEVGHSVCGEIHKLKFGRTYRLYEPEEMKAFHEAGGHGDDGCPPVCAAAARIAADIILRLRGSA